MTKSQFNFTLHFTKEDWEDVKIKYKNMLEFLVETNHCTIDNARRLWAATDILSEEISDGEVTRWMLAALALEYEDNIILNIPIEID